MTDLDCSTTARLPGFLTGGRLNPVLRGWGNYFRTGNATLTFKNHYDFLKDDPSDHPDQ